MKFPYQSLIEISKNSAVPVYRQIANAISMGIEQGFIRPGSKLPGSRELAAILGVNRNTITSAFDDLSDQGWLHRSVPVGTFVSKKIPNIQPKKLNLRDTSNYPDKTGYKLRINPILEEPSQYIPKNNYLELDEGLPDVRLAPMTVLNRTYRNVAKRIYSKENLYYTDVCGNKDLRRELSSYLNSTRGLRTSEKNIFITRGSQMALYLAIMVIVSPGDNVVIGDTNYFLANITLANAGGKLIHIPVDDFGINTDFLEEVCRKKKIRAVYVTPHHHYPTTVTLISERRIKLLALAEKYKFCIIEDDYDFDFHYSSSPILPLASADTKGMVIYIGSLFKSIAPGIRVGYLSAPVALINEITKLRRIIDMQGDSILEQAAAEMMKEGEIRRYMKKTVIEYQKRRDIFCELLQTKLGNEISFKIPNGGMAIWSHFDKSIDLKQLSQKALKKKLIISDGIHYNTAKQNLNSTRLGFASLTPHEIEKSIQILTDIIKH